MSLVLKPVISTVTLSDRTHRIIINSTSLSKIELNIKVEGQIERKSSPWAKFGYSLGTPKTEAYFLSVSQYKIHRRKTQNEDLTKK